ncbi:hypothetical protein [Deinococcus misasensis]|uniref:hypothetical protein n=1 Tax=Deinococcus misasensis TaxID=392413 RepID=UPI0005599ADE|nr:hypothetical protein [Deinococcus misasensis]
MNRDQRLKKVFQSMTLTGVLISLLTVLTSMVQDQFPPNSEASDFWHGVVVGIRTAFPFAFLFLVVRAYFTMDEYGRLQMVKAAAVGFLVTMVFSMGYYPLQEAGKIPALPVYTQWLLGLIAFMVSMGVQSRS